MNNPSGQRLGLTCCPICDGALKVHWMFPRGRRLRQKVDSGPSVSSVIIRGGFPKF